MIGVTYADVLRLEGKELGKAEGKAEGKMEGKAEGKAEVLIRQGRKKFGEPDAALLKTLLSIVDLERLDRMSDAIFDVKSWAELIAVL